MVIDEGVLFHTKTAAFRQTKRKLLSECTLWAVVSLPGNVFVNAGAGSKTNLLFFDKGKETSRVWYYDLSDIHVTKRKPLTFDHFRISSSDLRLTHLIPSAKVIAVGGARSAKSRRKTSICARKIPTPRI